MPPVQRPPPSTIFFRPISCLSLSPSRCCCCLFTLRLVLPPPYVRSFVHTHLSRSLVTTYSLLSPPFLTYLLVNLLTPSHSPHPLLFFSSFLLPRFFFASFRSLHIPGDRPLRGLLSGTRRSGVCDRPQRRTHCQPRCRISLSASLFNSTQLRAPSCPTAPIPYQYPFTGLHCTYMHRQFTLVPGSQKETTRSLFSNSNYCNSKHNHSTSYRSTDSDITATSRPLLGTCK